jgi:hypothetical protein
VRKDCEYTGSQEREREFTRVQKLLERDVRERANECTAGETHEAVRLCERTYQGDIERNRYRHTGKKALSRCRKPHCRYCQAIDGGAEAMRTCMSSVVRILPSARLLAEPIQAIQTQRDKRLAGSRSRSRSMRMSMRANAREKRRIEDVQFEQCGRADVMKQHSEGRLAERAPLRHLRPLHHAQVAEAVHARIQQREVGVGVQADGALLSTRSSVECGRARSC